MSVRLWALPDLAYDVMVECEGMIPIRNGVRLAAGIYHSTHQG